MRQGYKLVRATRGVAEGTWFCEWSVPAESKPGGHVRLGWANECADAHAAVGFDEHSYAVRDVGGSRVHQSVRSTYGAPFAPGDVVGCLISFDTPAAEVRAAERGSAGNASAGPADGGRVRQAQTAAAGGAATRRDVEALLFKAAPPARLPWSEPYGDGAASTSAAGQHSAPAPPPLLPPAAPFTSAAQAWSAASLHQQQLVQQQLQPTAGGGGAAGGPPLAWRPGDPIPKNAKRVVNQRAWGSSLRFYVNGVDQGVAFVHLTRENRYYPAASCYDGGAVRFNPGPVFAFPPPASSTAEVPVVAVADGTGGGGSAADEGGGEVVRLAPGAGETGSADSVAAATPASSATASSAASPTPHAPATTTISLPWPAGKWRPFSQLESEGGGGGGAAGEASGSLYDLLRLPFRDHAREQPSLEGLQQMLAAGGRKGTAPVTFTGAATASYSYSLGLGRAPPPAPAAVTLHRGLSMPGSGSVTAKAAQLLGRATAAKAVHAAAAAAAVAASHHHR